ncbi:MAG: hypothetical protein HY047_20100 [Acidobacteria bacterium]|nr:hypothetical protein [Acidobacteriota bacterium]
MGKTLIALSLIVACAVVHAGCKRETAPTLPPSAAPPDPAIAEAAALAALPIHVDQPLGSDLQLVGLSVEARPDHRSWVVTLHSKVLRKQNPRAQLWLHAYPKGSHEYFIVDLISTSPPADAGRVVTDGFLLKKAGAFDMYAGVMGADGSYGPAFGLGWVGVGDPDTKAYHEAYRFLQEANDARAAAMLEQARRDYPNAKLP